MDKALDEIISTGPQSRPRRISKRSSRTHERSTWRAPRERTKLSVSNLHYDLTEADLYDLFSKVGELTDLKLHFDRNGRSTGRATVEYKHLKDTDEAVRRFDGKKAAGQTISIRTERPLRQRIALPGDRVGGAPRSSSHGRRREPREPRERRERREPGQPGSGRRPKKTQEELDAELNSYFTSGPDAAPESNGDTFSTSTNAETVSEVAAPDSAFAPPPADNNDDMVDD